MEAARLRSIAVSSSPAPPPLTVGTSSTEATATPTLMGALVPPSVEVAVTVREKSALSSSGGVMVSEPMSAADTRQPPEPSSLPADMTEPAGMPVMVT